MKLIYIFILIFFGQVACSQKNIKITKVRSTEKRTYKCQELCYKDSILIWELNYSYNGWQITDSVYYINEDSAHCAKIYFATYDEDPDSTSTPHYEYRYLDCDQYDYLKTQSFYRINDTYSLSKRYLEDLELLLGLDPNSVNDEFEFEKPVIPSILTKYGIPYNEQMSSFSFELNDSRNLILNDAFIFENYVVIRKYDYQEDMLEKVSITVTSKENGQTKKYSESFKIDPL